jgi:abequosyltransferase
MNYPILSICIPTYNRATYLDETINSIVTQKRFFETDDVEIVISDNCSQDETENIVKKYINIFGDKIRYYRNPVNIKDSNFEKVLRYGNGLFLKLNNDTLNHKENTLDVMIDAINKNIKSKTIIFFSNGTSGKHLSTFRCNDLNSFVKVVSFWSTWIACFGIWKEDLKAIKDFSRYSDLQLVQTDVLLRLISSGRAVYVDNSIIFKTKNPKHKGGYNFYKVFVLNYLSLLEEYTKSNQISRTTYFNEKTKLLLYHILPTSLSILKDKTKYSFNLKGAFPIVIKKYFFHPILYLCLIYFFIKVVLIFLRKKLVELKK